MNTPNPDHDEMLEKVKDQEKPNVSCFNTNFNDEQIINKNSNKKHSARKFLDFSENELWNECLDVEEEKNNIQSLCENKFRMKSFLDEKFEQASIKSIMN